MAKAGPVGSVALEKCVVLCRRNEVWGADALIFLSADFFDLRQLGVRLIKHAFSSSKGCQAAGKGSHSRGFVTLLDEIEAVGGGGQRLEEMQ